VSGKLWGTLSDDERNTLKQCGLAARIAQRKASRAAEVETLEFLRKEGGMQVDAIPASEMQRIRERVQAVQQRATGTLGQEVVDRINAELTKIRGQ